MFSLSLSFPFIKGFSSISLSSPKKKEKNGGATKGERGSSRAFGEKRDTRKRLGDKGSDNAGSERRVERGRDETRTNPNLTQNPENEPNSNPDSNSNLNPNPNQNSNAIEKESEFPSIQAITREELESVPSYMKPRMTVERVNAGIEEINTSVLAVKYKILNCSLHPSKLSSKKLVLLQSYREYDSPETSGVNFFTDKDVAKSSKLKIDANGKNLFLILRSLHRIKEVRSKNVIKYLLL